MCANLVSNLFLYVKPAQGYVSQLPRRGNFKREIVDHVVRTKVGHAIPARSNMLDLQQQLDEQKHSASSRETVAEMENNWTSESPETVGVTEETYAKWFCQHYNLTRDQYEAQGCPDTTSSNKSVMNNCDADQSLVDEVANTVPEKIMDEIREKKIHRRFMVDTLVGDGEPLPKVVEEEVKEEEEVVSDSPQLEQNA